MRLLAIILLAAAGMAFSSPAHATPRVGLNDVVATLEQGYQVLRDLQADFTQQAFIAAMKIEQRSSGELFLKRGGSGNAMFRFNYAKPRQQIISDGKSAWYYLPDNGQVMVTEMAALFEGGNNVALSYLTGMGHLSRDFTISFAGEGQDRKGNYLLELVPRKPSQVMAKLQMTVSGKAVDGFVSSGKAQDPFPLVSSTLYDHLGNRTRIDFSRIRVNRGVSSSLFTFKIPAGVEVIRPGR